MNADQKRIIENMLPRLSEIRLALTLEQVLLQDLRQWDLTNRTTRAMIEIGNIEDRLRERIQ